jgi:hypothetical protein
LTLQPAVEAARRSLLGRNLGTLQQRHDDRGVHVEGERRRRAALAQRFISDRVVEKACAQTSPFLADRQRQEPFLTQAVVVLDGMAGLAIVRRREGGEIGGQLAAFVL